MVEPSGGPETDKDPERELRLSEDARHRWRRSLAALLAVGLVILSAYVVLQTEIQAQGGFLEAREDVETQRTLVLSSTDLAHRLATSEDPIERATVRERLADASAELERTREHGAAGSGTLDAAASDDAGLGGADGTVDADMQTFSVALARVLETPTEELTLEHPALTELHRLQRSLVAQLDTQEAGYTAAAADAGSTIQLASFTLMAAATSGIVATGLFVVRPAIEGLEDEARRLRDQNQALLDDLEARAEAAEARNRELERSNEDLRQFAYVASHDLQEPLRMVSSYVQMLDQRYSDELDEDAEAFIGYAVEGAQRMSRLIHDLLAYSRVGAEPRPLEPVDLEEVVEAALENLKVAIEERDATIEVGELPRVTGDRGQLVQLFQNLISNGIKFTEPGDTPVVRVLAEPDGERWKVCVEDEGVGFDDAYSEKLFQIFQRAHDRQQFGGTGVGLAICKKIVSHHDGAIWAESAPGEGARFWFTLSPAADPEQGIEPIEEPSLETLTDRSRELV